MVDMKYRLMGCGVHLWHGKIVHLKGEIEAVPEGVVEAVLNLLYRREDKGFPFYGDRVFAVGPAGECVTVEVPPKG